MLKSLKSFKIEYMGLQHLDLVDKIEQESFSIPWSKEELKKEIVSNPIAKYLVAIDEFNQVLGYIGMWCILDEGHITNVAVKQDKRGQGVGSFLIQELFKLSKFLKISSITLEVKMSNITAQKLYTKHGFKPEGLRKNYYKDTKEDAIIMWKYF